MNKHRAHLLPRVLQTLQKALMLLNLLYPNLTILDSPNQIIITSRIKHTSHRLSQNIIPQFRFWWRPIPVNARCQLLLESIREERNLQRKSNQSPLPGSIVPNNSLSTNINNSSNSSSHINVNNNNNNSNSNNNSNIMSPHLSSKNFLVPIVDGSNRKEFEKEIKSALEEFYKLEVVDKPD